jgi:hypothetical protein
MHLEGYNYFQVEGMDEEELAPEFITMDTKNYKP